MTASIWLIIAGGTLVTYLTRLSFIALLPTDRMPPLLLRGLRFVPPAVLAAIIAPELLQPEATLALSLSNDRLLAGLLAAFVAVRTRNTWLTIGVGMIALWILSAV
jgi:branched-subunit amino acid transport protein